jgi:hypothetical protein
MSQDVRSRPIAVDDAADPAEDGREDPQRQDSADAVHVVLESDSKTSDHGSFLCAPAGLREAGTS